MNKNLLEVWLRWTQMDSQLCPSVTVCGWLTGVLGPFFLLEPVLEDRSVCPSISVWGSASHSPAWSLADITNGSFMPAPDSLRVLKHCPGET